MRSFSTNEAQHRNHKPDSTLAAHLTTNVGRLCYHRLRPTSRTFIAKFPVKFVAVGNIEWREWYIRMPSCAQDPSPRHTRQVMAASDTSVDCRREQQREHEQLLRTYHSDNDPPADSRMTKASSVPGTA